MSEALARLRAIFVEPSTTTAGAIGRPRVALPIAPRRPIAPPPTPTVVVLCEPARSRAAAGALALALARAVGAPCAIVSAPERGAGSSASGGPALPAARRAAAHLRSRGTAAAASGRLVWLADRRLAPDGVLASDPAGAAAAASAATGRAAVAAGLPAVVAIPLARTAALDRALAWHDAVVAVRGADESAELTDCIVASLSALGLPVTCMPPLSRYAGWAAEMGLHTPAPAAHAIAQLGLAALRDA